MMFSSERKNLVNEGKREIQENGERDHRDRTDSNIDDSSTLEQRGNLTAAEGMQEQKARLKQWQQRIARSVFENEFNLFLESYQGDKNNLSPQQIASLLIEVKNKQKDQFIKEGISESNMMDRLYELAEQKAGGEGSNEFVFKTFDESLEGFQQTHASIGSSYTAAPASITKRPEDQALELIHAAKTSPFFSKIFQPKRVKWCLAWAESRDYSQEVRQQIQDLASRDEVSFGSRQEEKNRDEVSFGSREEEKNQYQALYRIEGVNALETAFTKLLRERSKELQDAAFNDPNEIAGLLMMVRLQFHSVVDSEENIIEKDRFLLSLATAQGDLVKDAFCYYIFDQSLNQIREAQDHQTGTDRKLSDPELAEQLIQAVKQSSFITTLPVEQRLSYCQGWARSRLANEELLNLIHSQWNQ